VLKGLWQGVGIAGHLLELTRIVGGIGEAALARAVNELYQLVKGDSGDVLDGGEALDDGPAGSAEDIGERFLVGAGALTGFEIQDGQAVGLLLGQGVNDVVAIAGEETQRQIGSLVAEGGGQVTPQAEPVGDHDRIQRVGMVQVHMGFLEVGGQAWIEGVECHRPCRERRIVAQGVKEKYPSG
jgi:hypothetical protein